MTIHGTRLPLAFAGMSGATAVLAGAWASHAGGAVPDAGMIRLVEIGARYQLIHAAALIACVAVAAGSPGRSLRLASLLFGVGTVLFSGSLYLLAATGLSMLGMVTPFGGLCFVAGWLMLAIHAVGVNR